MTQLFQIILVFWSLQKLTFKFLIPTPLKSITPTGFQLTHRPRMAGFGGGVDFLTRKDLPTKTVDAPTYSTFKNIVISIVTHSKSFVVACVYYTPSSCSSAFLDDFLFFCSFCHL